MESWDAEARTEPSGDHATQFARIVCPERTRTQVEFAAAQRRTERSSEAVAMSERSGEMAHESTRPSWPESVESVHGLLAMAL